jgi:hypothetical protein
MLAPPIGRVGKPYRWWCRRHGIAIIASIDPGPACLRMSVAGCRHRHGGVICMDFAWRHTIAAQRLHQRAQEGAADAGPASTPCVPQLLQFGIAPKQQCLQGIDIVRRGARVGGYGRRLRVVRHVFQNRHERPGTIRLLPVEFALGTRLAIVGRPCACAAAVAGKAGVAHGLTLPKEEVSRNMAMPRIRKLNKMTMDRLVALDRQAAFSDNIATYERAA